MKWVNHEILTGVLVYTATRDPLSTAFSMAGAIIPDKIEGRPGSLFWRSRHRGWSHWPLLYIGLMGILLGLADTPVPALPEEARRGGLFLAIGALLHIAEDALCGKVPLLRPDKKVGLRLFKVGSFREYFITILCVLLCYFLSTIIPLSSP